MPELSIRLCPTCLRAFQPSEHGPGICEDCWSEHIARTGMGGRVYITPDGSRHHSSPLCRHVRGSRYYMVSHESATYSGRAGQCKDCLSRSSRGVVQGGA